MCRSAVLFVAILALAGGAFALSGPFMDPQTLPNRAGIVHLFEWKWLDIAKECEQFLAPKGYAAVQISPPTENVVVWSNGARTWWERYQPISYRLVTRSGNEQEFEEMCRRCNNVGVRVYADLVINHMTGNCGSGVGTGGSKAEGDKMSYPAVPYTPDHFHKPQCQIKNFSNPIELRNCELVGLHDLDHSQAYVRGKIVELLNHMIDLGIAGFRVDAAKHMWPHELLQIMENMKPLNTNHGFAPNTKPFVYQEVADFGGDPVTYHDYTPIGRIIDFQSSQFVSKVFGGKEQLRTLRWWGPAWRLVESSKAVVFVDNHDTQREKEIKVLTYKQPKQYKMAAAFMLAFPHGFPRVMCSYAFDNFNLGPPSDSNWNIVSPQFGADGQCTNGYICEHRWGQIANMIAFKITAGDSPVANWWDNGGNQIAFSRGNKAFIAFNNENGQLNQALTTGLPEGTYCDVISGGLNASGRGCTGKVVKVASDSKANIYIGPEERDGVLAIHIGAKTK